MLELAASNAVDTTAFEAKAFGTPTKGLCLKGLWNPNQGERQPDALCRQR